MTDKEKLEKVRAEIERVKKNQEGVFTSYTDGKFDLCEYLLDFIDSMQKEPASEELEEAAEMFIDTLMPTEVDTVTPFAAEYVIGLLNKAIEFGANWQKQQLMAKAVDATVHIDAGGYPYIPQMELYDYDKDIPLAKEGEKVKVIVIKED